MKEKFVISIFSQLMITIFTSISNYFLMLFLDVEIMGIWVLLNSIINIGFIFTDLGLISIHFQYSEKKNFNDYFGSFLTIKLILIFINVVFSLVLVSLFSLWVSIYFPIVLALLISKTILNLINIFSIHLYGKLKIFKVELPLLVINISQNIFIIYIALNISNIVNPLFWISIFFVLFSIVYALIIIPIYKSDFGLKKPKKTFILDYLKDTKHLIAFTILSVITANIGNVILGYSFDNETLAYFYLVNGYIIPTIGVITSSMISICTPLYSKYLAKNDLDSIKNVVYTVEKYVSIVILCLLIVIYLIGDKIFLIFLPKYLKSLPILYILIIYAYIEGVNRNYAILLISGKKQKLSAYLSIIFAIFRLVLIFTLIPKTFFNFEMLGLGSLGYTLALLLPPIIYTFIIRIFNRKLFHLKLQKNLLLQIPIALFLILLMLVLRNYILESLIQSDIILIIILVFLALPTFIFLLFVSKILKKNDLIFFFELFKLNKYKRSMKNEFL